MIIKSPSNPKTDKQKKLDGWTLIGQPNIASWFDHDFCNRFAVHEPE